MSERETFEKSVPATQHHVRERDLWKECSSNTAPCRLAQIPQASYSLHLLKNKTALLYSLDISRHALFLSPQASLTPCFSHPLFLSPQASLTPCFSHTLFFSRNAFLSPCFSHTLFPWHLVFLWPCFSHALFLLHIVSLTPSAPLATHLLSTEPLALDTRCCSGRSMMLLTCAADMHICVSHAHPGHFCLVPFDSSLQWCLWPWSTVVPWTLVYTGAFDSSLHWCLGL